MKSLNHDATNSWNGYSYQGKTAIYTVLKIINDQGLVNEDVNKFELELEYLEDFSIIHNGKEISIHQVKTYNSSAPYEYKDAVWTLLGKLAMKSHIHNAYLHTTEKLPDKTILKEKYKNSSEPKASNSENQLNPNEYYHYVIDNELYESVFEKFDLFLYGDDLYHCNLTDIKNKILMQLSRYYKERGIYRSEEHYNRLYYYLLSIIDNHVSHRHELLQERKADNKNRMISFSVFYDAINCNFEESSKLYYTYVLRELYSSVCEQFLYDTQNQATSIAFQRVKTFYDSVRSVDDNSFLKLCKKWTPHIQASEINLKTFHNLIPVQGLRDPLLKALYVFNEPLHQDQSVFLRKNESGLNIVYLPTTLHERPTSLVDDELLDEKQVSRIAKDIIMNSDIEDLHEVDVMISSHIPMSSLEEAAYKYTHISHEEIENDVATEEDKFMKIKRIRMVNFPQARKELE
ncbi:ABC-three component system protein [Paenibacillus amylolyticus]|uniref:ABC-three component system protein n=1 Tax=Paenibacillus amylolyticus TaxID=1451 RepID=UPI000B82BDAF|nr:ABC-three component system protein [Paenibacillus amylolyticus]